MANCDQCGRKLGYLNNYRYDFNKVFCTNKCVVKYKREYKKENQKTPWWKINNGYDVGRFIIASVFLIMAGLTILSLSWTIIILLVLWGFIFLKNGDAGKQL